MVGIIRVLLAEATIPIIAIDLESQSMGVRIR